MRQRKFGIIVAICIGVIALGVIYFNLYKANSNEPTQVEVIVPVKTTKIIIKDLARDITVYGTVIPAPGAIDVLSVPFESYINKIMVNNGQMVSKGDALLEIQPSLNTKLSFFEAKASYKKSEQSLQHLEELLKLKLATNDQLLNAELAFQQAKLHFENLINQGIGTEQKNLLVNTDGIVKLVNVQQGAIVPPGTTLVEIISQNRFEVKLGIEAEDIHALKVDQNVVLTQVYGNPSSTIEGKIRKLSYAVNPSSKLVDIFVDIPRNSSFLLGELVIGSIKTISERGMVVPRKAILPEKNHFVLFTVRNDRAVKHIVSLGIENDEEAIVFGETLAVDEPVVVLGNYILSNGLKVQVEHAQ